MKLASFVLEDWLDEHEHNVQYNLAGTTGPPWTLRELLGVASPEEKDRFWDAPVSYGDTPGGESLRRALAAMYGAHDEDLQVVTGASEALLILFFLAAEPGANVVVPAPGFPPFTEIPGAMGLETRRYLLRRENAYRLEVDEVRALVDAHTRLVLVNTPHNPTGGVVDDQRLRELHDFCAERGIPFVVDEVYHPIFHGLSYPSAAALPHATVLGDMSKAFSLSGLRVGWILERDERRRRAYRTSRGYFTISNGTLGEVLAEVAIRHREEVLSRAQTVARANLDLLEDFFEAHADVFDWHRPEGGFTAFPRLLTADDARPLCQEAAAQGVLLAPGDCFGYPSHLRLGFGAVEEGFDKALEILSRVMTEVTR